MLPHFAYPAMVLLTLVLLPALLFMPATDIRTLVIIDLPLCMGATGSLDRFATLAPVIATRGGHAVGSDPRIAVEARRLVLLEPAPRRRRRTSRGL